MLSLTVVIALVVGGGFWFQSNGEQFIDNAQKPVNLREFVATSKALKPARDEILFQREVGINERQREIQWQMEQAFKSMPPINTRKP